MFGLGLQSTAVGERQPREGPRRRRPRPNRDPFAHSGIEPSVEDLINDPVTRAVMMRDNVTEGALRSLVAHMRPVLRQVHPVSAPMRKS